MNNFRLVAKSRIKTRFPFPQGKIQSVLQSSRSLCRGMSEKTQNKGFAWSSNDLIKFRTY